MEFDPLPEEAFDHSQNTEPQLTRKGRVRRFLKSLWRLREDYSTMVLESSEPEYRHTQEIDPGFLLRLTQRIDELRGVAPVHEPHKDDL